MKFASFGRRTLVPRAVYGGRYVNYMIRSKVAILLSVFLAGCTGIMGHAYVVFDEDLQRLAGTALLDAYIYNLGYLENVEPKEVKHLKTGNRIHAYEIEYVTRKSMFNSATKNWSCTVYLEIAPESEIIINASSSGTGCWRNY